MKIEGRPTKVKLFWLFDENLGKGRLRSDFICFSMKIKGRVDWGQTLMTSRWRSRKGRLRSDFDDFLMKIEGRANWGQTLMTFQWRSREGRLRSDFACFLMKIKERPTKIRLCFLPNENWGKANWDQTSLLVFRWKSKEGQLTSGFLARFSMKIKGRPNEVELLFKE